ncbi:Putative L-lactate dehydrogenase operon regulatory protein [Variovorax sp. SRS16]|uniref:FadR/GntR family transcriptional regulator n=1 Tax=Variovorax sp. SRS16 TaxID=282217 RepID=UPI0013182D7C|nr:FadR/GntR family transcriptional regulator [Variovorax sp. SRS16]VTU23881.1 Putative L-lactate dehydrogenase operon regulatory protein [Variovorax sp. SRS16]
MNDVKLSPIRAPKNSDLLARELRRRILDGALEPGMPLPAERELMAQTGLSRGSVREALRILETESLVRTRPGRLGGTVASRPDDQSMHRSVSLFVGGRGISLLSLLQTREAVEPSLAALAAQNRTAAELQNLVDVTRRVEEAFADVPQFLRENVNWHCAIADASHNELLRAFMLSIANLVYKASAIENFATEDVRHTVIRAHRRILAAITEKDAEAANRRMARHLAALSAACKKFPNAPLVIEV